MNYLQIEFKIENDVEKEILIALLSNAGFESFEDPMSSVQQGNSIHCPSGFDVQPI